MYIVGQPPRLSGQAERLSYNVGSWLPDYFFGPLQTIRRELKRARDHECDWEFDRYDCDHESHNPVWNFQERKTCVAT
jgi:hypothetical protein